MTKRYSVALEKANISCHSECKGLDEKFARTEKDRIQCEFDKDMLRDAYNNLEIEHAEYRSACKQEIDNEKQFKACQHSLIILCEKVKADCFELYRECQDSLDKKWF